MLFRQLFDVSTSTYTYLLANDYGCEALIIDPVIEQCPFYFRLFNELNLKLKMSVDTHIHADHITGSSTLREQTGCDIVMGETSCAEGITKKIKDQEIFGVEGIELKALYTPGHSSESYSFLMPDRVFTGDTLLIRSTGRTDLQNGDPYKAYDSLFNKLLLLPDETLVYPAHNYQGIMVSTIGEEKKFNPRLQVKNSAEYAELMQKLNLSLPNKIDVSIPANLQCGFIK